jgi:hypothetical protein
VGGGSVTSRESDMMEPHRPSVARLPGVGDAERRTIPSRVPR